MTREPDPWRWSREIAEALADLPEKLIHRAMRACLPGQSLYEVVVSLLQQDANSKRCQKCGRWKLLAEFSRRAKKSDKRRSLCKACASKALAKWSAAQATRRQRPRTCL